MRARALTISIGVCSTLLVSCSDDGSGQLTKAEYIEKGDELCLELVEDFEQLADDAPETPEESVEFFETIVELAERTLEDFESLAPPDDGTTVHRELVSALRESIVKVREARTAVERRDAAAAAAAFREGAQIGMRSDAPAKAYGFQVCGSESQLRTS